jgi:hypothetical protein
VGAPIAPIVLDKLLLHPAAVLVSTVLCFFALSALLYGLEHHPGF